MLESAVRSILALLLLRAAFGFSYHQVEPVFHVQNLVSRQIGWPDQPRCSAPANSIAPRLHNCLSRQMLRLVSTGVHHGISPANPSPQTMAQPRQVGHPARHFAGQCRPVPFIESNDSAGCFVFIAAPLRSRFTRQAPTPHRLARFLDGTGLEDLLRRDPVRRAGLVLGAPDRVRPPRPLLPWKAVSAGPLVVVLQQGRPVEDHCGGRCVRLFIGLDKKKTLAVG